MNRIVFVGEAWGKDEEMYKHPFVGAAGQELYRMLGQSGFPCEELPYHFVSPTKLIRLWKVFPYPLLNVFNCRPPDPLGKNNAEYFYASLSENTPVNRDIPRRKFGSANKWVKAEYADHVFQLHSSLQKLKPNLIIALGATALWALGLPTGIGKLRGSVVQSAYGKVLPIYHPAAILRNWGLRTISLLDFHKAGREAEYPEIKTKNREIWTEPTISDLYTWWDKYGSQSSLLAFDIETIRYRQISEIGLAADPEHALHIPFVIEQNKHYQSWWPDVATEAKAWQFVRMVCESDIPKIGQNVLQYDTYWMLKEMGIASQQRNPGHNDQGPLLAARVRQKPRLPGLRVLRRAHLEEHSNRRGKRK